MPKPKQKEAENQTGAAAEAVTETVRQIPLSDLHPFEGHPFKVLTMILWRKLWRASGKSG